MGVMLNRSGLKNLGPEKLGPEKLGPERLGPERLGPVWLHRYRFDDCFIDSEEILIVVTILNDTNLEFSSNRQEL